jgi:hypothetical protein
MQGDLNVEASRWSFVRLSSFIVEIVVVIKPRKASSEKKSKIYKQVTKGSW